MPSIVVHGGAGREDAVSQAARRAGVGRAAQAGWNVLARGGSALDAVVTATVVLEDDEHFNAGRGSVLTEESLVEMDASVMDGARLAAGAVAAVSRVRNPVLAARAVLDAGREVLLVGDRACEIVARAGVTLVDPETLVTHAARAALAARRQSPGDTVGAVARDAGGHVAAATSTGGVTGKRAGRVGDSAVIGAGTYADDRLGAVSCTGPGEAIIRLSLGRVALGRLAGTPDPGAACREALAELAARLGATAGLIVVAPAGEVGFAHTTPAMPVAWRTEGGRGDQTGRREAGPA
jgi:beta-aspartyl-peptidase (threonine type)